MSSIQEPTSSGSVINCSVRTRKRQTQESGVIQFCVSSTGSSSHEGDCATQSSATVTADQKQK